MVLDDGKVENFKINEVTEHNDVNDEKWFYSFDQ